MRVWAFGLLIATGLLATPMTALSQTMQDGQWTMDDGQPIPPVSRVRSNNRSILDLMTRATEQSTSFRRLIETINASDGLVYVEPGGCRHGVRACLIDVKSAGQQRVLFIKVDMKRSGRDLLAAIGHELQHAVEVLSEPAVTDYSSMYFFYKANADQIGTSMSYETKAAVKAGEDIREEIRKFERAKAASDRR